MHAQRREIAAGRGIVVSNFIATTSIRYSKAFSIWLLLLGVHCMQTRVLVSAVGEKTASECAGADDAILTE